MVSYKLNNVSKNYKNKNEIIEVFNNINITLPSIGLVFFSGRTSSGKTTLFNLLSFLDKPSSGEILYYDKKITKTKTKDNIRYYDISLISSNNNLFDDLNVKENLKFIYDLQKKRVDEEKINKTLDYVNLSRFENKKINQLNKYELLRLTIAVSIIKDSKIIICDEITSDIDKHNSTLIYQLLKEISKEKLVIVISSQDNILDKISNIKYKIVDKQITLVKGQIEDSFNRKLDISYLDNNPKISILFILKTIFKSFLSTKIFSIIFVLVCSFMLCISTVYFSLLYFDQERAIFDILQKEQNYLPTVVKYDENSFSTIINYFSSSENSSNSYVSSLNDYTSISDDIGSHVIKYTYDTTKNDYKLLEDTLNNRCDYYECNFLNIPFKHINENLDESNSFVYLKAFSTLIRVKNFNNFHQPLLKGRLPSSIDEVLIFDYMEDGLKYYNVIKGDILEQTISSKIYDINFKVVGVLKSNYDQIENNFPYTNFFLYKKEYYGSLTSIIASDSFYLNNLTKIKNSTPYHSIELSQNYYKEENEQIKYSFPSKLNILDSNKYKEYNWDYNITNKSLYLNNSDMKYYFNNTFAISKKLAMKIANINNEEEFNNASFGTDFRGSRAFCEAFNIKASSTTYNKGVTIPKTGGEYYKSFDIIGILNEIDEEKAYYFEDLNEDSITTNNGAFDSFRVSLTNKKSVNKNIVGSLFLNEDKPHSYYEKLKQTKSGFSLYCSANTLVKEIYKYKRSYLNTITPFMIFSLVITLLITITYFIYLINKNLSRIKLYKKCGISLNNISLVSSFNSIIISALSLIISIPASFIYMYFINIYFSLSKSNISLLIFKPSTLFPLFTLGFMIFTLINIILLTFNFYKQR